MTHTPPALETLDGPLVFRMARPIRRAVTAEVGGVVLLLALACVIARAVGDWQSAIGLAVIFAVLGSLFLPFLVIPYRYRVRVDREGLWRRRLCGWDFWPWEDFANGRIQRDDEPEFFIHTGRPWWSRTFRPDILGGAGPETLLALLQQVCPSSPPPLPPLLTLPRESTPGRTVRLSADGILVDQSEHYAWSQVQRVQIIRTDHSSSDFQTIELSLEGRNKPLRLGRPTRRTGLDLLICVAAELPVHEGIAPQTQLLRYLEHYVPANRIEVTAMQGPARDAAEEARRRAELDHREAVSKQDAWFARAFLGLFLLGPVVTAICLPEPKNGVEMLEYGLAFGVVESLLLLIPFLAWRARWKARARAEARWAEPSQRQPGSPPGETAA